MSEIHLRAAHYRTEHHRAFSALENLPRAVAALGETIGRRVAEHGTPTTCPQRSNLVLCSTTISDLLYDREDLNALFRDLVEERCGAKVDQIISTYECASWGYALRHLAQQRRSGPITLVIMDPNLPFFEFWERDQVWGRSSHGCLVLSFDLRPSFDEALRVGCAVTGNGLFEFARAVQHNCEGWDDVPIFVPFLTPSMDPVMHRLGVRRRFAPNHYGQYGHCFGSDPWIGLIRHCTRDAEAAVSSAVVGSFALNGYHCMAKVAVGATAELSVDA